MEHLLTMGGDPAPVDTHAVLSGALDAPGVVGIIESALGDLAMDLADELWRQGGASRKARMCCIVS